MSELTSRIDAIPIPIPPDSFCFRDRELVKAAFENACQMARPFTGPYKASWLLSDFTSPQWATTNRGRESLKNGVWRDAVTINWDVPLPGGGNLLDPKYNKLLFCTRAIAFLTRNGHLQKNYTPIIWRAIVYEVLRIARWMVLNQARFRPETYAFSLLDQNGLDSLLRVLAEGAWDAALQFPQRLLSDYYLKIFNEPPTKEMLESPYNLPATVQEGFIEWFSSHGYYRKGKMGVFSGKRYLSRERLAHDINEPVASLRPSMRFLAFCRQFEPDFRHPLLTNICQSTEYPDQNTPLVIEATIRSVASDALVFLAAKTCSLIVSAHRHLPDHVPSPGTLSVVRAREIALRHSVSRGHTPFIPINTGLAYLRHAIRIVHLYGEQIVEFYLAVRKAGGSLSNSAENIAPLNAALLSLKNNFLVESEGRVRPVAEIFGIGEFIVRGRAHNSVGAATWYVKFRANPTLVEILRVVVGACVALIGFLKPSREAELTHLKRDCLRSDATGSYISYSLGKSNVDEAYREIERPVPQITARAVRLLQRLGNELGPEIAQDRKIKENLFLIPNDYSDKALAADQQLLNEHLDIFCDFVGLKPDRFGRRWYLRVHEMRKWFLLLLFWSGRFDVLDAARWIAGHADVSQVYAYLVTEFPGEDLRTLEAEYAVERLRALDTSDEAARGEPGLNSLYATVVGHFGVQSLAMIEASEWEDYVTVLRANDGFFIEPHSVYAKGNNEVIGINISFVLREVPSE